jgi:hypothetical protein
MSENIRTGLLTAYRKLMRPLVRILIRHGVTYHDFSELLKSIFVESAREDFVPRSRDVSLARIAILSGLTRDEVEEQLQILESGDLLPSSNLNQITRLLVGWHSDPAFTGPYGLPIELDADSTTGSSFSELVAKYSPGIEPRAILEELIQVGVVAHTRQDRLKVLMRAYIPNSLHPDGLERMGEVVCNFVGTVEKNMEKSRQGAGRFERVVYADDGLPPNLMPAFDKLLREKGQQLLVELDNWITTQTIEHPNQETARIRNIKTGVGIYHYVEPNED